MSQPWDALPGWLQQIGTLVGAGGGSVIVLKVIERVFARDDRQATDRTTISGELRQDIRDLKQDMEKMESRLETARMRIDALVTERAELSAQVRELRTENVGLRDRYHDLRGIMGVWVGLVSVYHEKLGLPESDLPEIPHWVYQMVPGPTARDTVKPPPEATP